MPVASLINEEVHTAEWLRTTLDGIPSRATIAPAGVWQDIIPEEKTLPGIRFQCQRRRDVSGGTRSSQRIMVELDWLVVGTVKGTDYISLVQVVDAIDSAIQGKNGTTAAVEVMSCLRQETFSMSEVGRSGVTFRHAGGIYRTLVVPL